jgi:dihydrofolate reductase
VDLAIIVAHDLNLGIGKDNRLLREIPEDLARFKRLTLGDQKEGYPLIMGRMTFDSIVSRNGKPLPNRPHIVMSQNPCFRYPGVHVAENFEQACELALLYNNKIFVLGGGRIYSLALPSADRLYITEIAEKHEADTFFPPYKDKFKAVRRELKSYKGTVYEFADYVKQ